MAESTSQGAAAAARLRTTTDRLLADVAQLPAELIHWIPAEGVWSVMDNLCHVREFIPFWTGQTRRMITTPSEAWGRDHTDTDRLDAVTNTRANDLARVTADIKRLAAESAAVLETLSDADLAKEATSMNPRWGLKPASFVVEHLIAGHVEKHIGQVRRNVTQYGERHPNAYPLAFGPVPMTSVPVAGHPQRIALRRIFCVGRNYEAHAKEMGAVADREAPFYFTKSSVHYAASGSAVPYAQGTNNFHYEMELVAVIGAPAFEVSVDHALTCVFGYTCGLDMTRRDLQFAARDQKRPWDLGKDVEHSAVMAPIVPASDIGHPRSGRIELRVNGETKQSSDLSLLIHGVPEVVAHLSRYYHLEPGDVIFTGTPEGVGPVKPGDRIEGSIEGVGSVSLTIASAT